METTSSKPGLFAYLQVPPPVGNEPFHKVARFLRLTGILVLVYAAVNVLDSVVTIAFASQLGAYGAAGAAGEIPSLVIALAISAAVSFWVSYTYFHWLRRDAQGWNHANYLGIVMIVLGGLGTLAFLVGLALVTLLFALAGPFGMILAIFVLAGGALTVLELVLGILIVTNRGKAQGTFGGAAPA